MMTNRQYVRRATARDLYFFANPQLWACQSFLPVTRQATDSPERQLGLLYDARGVSGTYGFGCTVFLTNLFTVPAMETRLFALPKHVYDTFDELADAGWIVD
jgi:hypothetical protein